MSRLWKAVLGAGALVLLALGGWQLVVFLRKAPDAALGSSGSSRPLLAPNAGLTPGPAGHLVIHRDQLIRSSFSLGRLELFDRASHRRVSTIPLRGNGKDEPYGGALVIAQGRLFVDGIFSQWLEVFDLTTMESVGVVPTSDANGALCASADEGRVVHAGTALLIIDPATLASRTVPLPPERNHHGATASLRKTPRRPRCLEHRQGEAAMSARAKRLSLLLIPASFALACGASSGPGSQSPDEEATPELCSNVGPMLDLRSELLTPVPASGNAARLALYDARLAALRTAEQRLGDNADSSELVTLRKRARALANELAQDQDGARSLAQAISDSHLRVNAELAKASTCQGFDLRLQATGKAKSVAESRKCADTRRIVDAVRGLDVDSRLESANMGRHLAELSMKGPVAAARDELSSALIAHAKHLAAFDEHTNSGTRASRMQTQIAELAEELDRVGARCLRGADEGSSVVAGTEPPRRITVLVRPTWEDQEGKSQDTGSFGSGVLVRWRLPSGETEVRVVSNAHVLGGAQNADIIAADELDNKPKNGKVDKTWRAHVLRISEDDDLAVLRLDDDASAPESGVTLRFSPPDEQETVVAAGFPGVGSRPSFQISQGTISNRKFAINEGAFGVYLQHTSPIDPGNSGGPLLDSDGRLLGLNTIKIRGRDNVGLAIPTARVLLALERADDARTFLPEHAAALCQSLLGELASDAPTGAIVDHMSLSLTAPGSQMVDRSVTAVRAAVRTEGAGPDWQARLTAFARLRARIDAEGGVPKLSVCSEPTKRADKGSFELTFASATETHKLQLANEGGVLRLVWVD